MLDRRLDKNCDTGGFELAFKNTPVLIPQYIGMSLQVDGVSIKKPRPPRLVDTAPRKPDVKEGDEEGTEVAGQEKPGGDKPGGEKLGGEKLGGEKLGGEKLGNDNETESVLSKPESTRKTAQRKVDKLRYSERKVTSSATTGSTASATASLTDVGTQGASLSPPSSGAATDTPSSATPSRGGDDAAVTPPQKMAAVMAAKSHPYSTELARINIINKYIASRQRHDYALGKTNACAIAAAVAARGDVAMSKEFQEQDLASDRTSHTSSMHSKLAKTLSKIKDTSIVQNVRFALCMNLFDEIAKSDRE